MCEHIHSLLPLSCVNSRPFGGHLMNRPSGLYGQDIDVATGVWTREAQQLFLERLIRDVLLSSGENMTVIELGVLTLINRGTDTKDFMTVSRIAEKVQKPVSTISRIVIQFIERGWVVDEIDTEDRRRYLLKTHPGRSEAHRKRFERNLRSFQDAALVNNRVALRLGLMTPEEAEEAHQRQHCAVSQWVPDEVYMKPERRRR